MKALRFLLAAALAAGALPLPAAATWSGHFEPLRKELRRCRDTMEAEGVLGRTARARWRAVERSLALLDRDVPDFGADLKTAGRVASRLARGYPGEVRGSVAAPLGGILESLFGNLHDGVAQDLHFLYSACGGIDDGTRSKVDRCIARAGSLLEGADRTNLRRWGRSLVRAHRQWRRGMRTLAAAPPAPRSMEMTVDGLPGAIDSVDIAWQEATGSLSLSAAGTSAPPCTLLAMAGEPVFGPGLYPLAAAAYHSEALSPVAFTATGGTLEVTALDPGAGTISIVVTFTGTGPPEMPGSVAVVLAYEGPFFHGN